MIHHPVPQQSEEWFRKRAGIPTSSNFSKIVTPTGKLSKQADEYACRLIAERLLGESFPKALPFAETFWMERGSMLEGDAVALYEFEVGEQTEPIGFIVNDDGTAGCSPDRMVGERGLVEIKCPAPWVHIENLLAERIDASHIPQVQGQLLITGREWVDWYSYHPELPPSRIRTERDEAYLKVLRDALAQFHEMMLKKIEVLANKGYYKVLPREFVTAQNKGEEVSV
jgi:hypothetical protein